MEDSAAQAVRGKRDSSIRVASRLVRDGVAAGPGLGGQHRRRHGHGQDGAGHGAGRGPAGAGLRVSHPQGHARRDDGRGRQRGLLAARCWRSSPSWARSTRASSSTSKNPRVGLLSIGEEEHKGNELTRTATPLLKTLPINFIGNVEGRDLYSGKADVIVCDGFIGNVALKVSEGLVDVIKQMLQESLRGHHHAEDRLRALPGRLQRISRSAWTIPSTAARRCSASTASASSATGARTPTPSRTPSGWPPSSAERPDQPADRKRVAPLAAKRA